MGETQKHHIWDVLSPLDAVGDAVKQDGHNSLLRALHKTERLTFSRSVEGIA